jgi:hypothetical protein
MPNKETKSSSIRLPEELRRYLKAEAFARYQRGEPEPSFGDLLLEAWRRTQNHRDHADDRAIAQLDLPPDVGSLLEAAAGEASQFPADFLRDAIAAWHALADLGLAFPLSPEALASLQRALSESGSHAEGKQTTLYQMGSDPRTHHALNSVTVPPLTELEQIALDQTLRVLRSPKPGLPDALLSNLLQFSEFADLYDEHHPHSTSGPAPRNARGAGGDRAAVDALGRDARDARRGIDQAERTLREAVRRGESPDTAKAKPPHKARKRS